MSDVAQVLREWFDLWNEHALDRLADRVTPDYAHHAMGGADLDLAGFQAGFAMVLAAFPDLHYTVEHAFTDGDMGAAYLVADATHQGDYFGVAGTGRPVQFRGVYHCRVDGTGLIAEDWDVFDLLTPLLRLGASIVAAQQPV